MIKDIEKMLEIAEIAAYEAAKIKYNELKGQGPKYNVTHNGTSVGTMLDLCGFSYCYIPTQKGFNRRNKKIKELLSQNKIRWDDYRKAFVLRLRHVDQAVSVNEASANAAWAVINQCGLKCYTETRLD